ncbi:glycosyl hydrolase [Aspergillus stella-maris]|uniref:glycosyl hydrolase n=1 Tax=Aspergillus stella-maris TaxID=1810926 RepID=UPI003CCD8D60
MWWHADNSTYGWLLQGLATFDTVEGPYEFVAAVAPFGNWSQDFGLFTDREDGRSYAFYSNGDSADGRDVYLTRFNTNITALEEVVYRFPKYDLGAPTIIQSDNSYWAMLSHKTGYRPNNVVAFHADDLSGPWSQPLIVSPLNTSIHIDGTRKTTYLYLGDQWVSNTLWESRYIWLPINIDEHKQTLGVEWHDVHDLDVKTGEWHGVKGKKLDSHEGHNER